MNKALAEKVKANIICHALIKNGDSVLVAVSGGADSVCLLDLLVSFKHTFSMEISVAHVNHMLRGAEANRDEEFVRSLCKTYAVPFYSAKIDVRKLAKDRKISEEEAGRIARYNFFNELQAKHGITKIATAHNKNDNVETVCMRFMRGTGIKGLGGIPPFSDAGVIRPLLSASRREIEAYLNEKGLSYVTDSSNLGNDYTRNKVRHMLIPHIVSAYNENFVDTLCENIAVYKETASFLETCTQNAMDHIVCWKSYGAYAPIARLLQEDIAIAKRVIKEMILKISDVSVTAQAVQNIYDAAVNKSSASVCVSKHAAVYIAYGNLYVADARRIADIAYTVDIAQGSGEITYSDKNVIYIKQSIEPEKLSVRTRMPGDCIYLDNCGRKKVKDIMIDEKIPVFLRDSIPVVLYNEEIIWVCGVRDNPAFRAKPGEPYIKLTYKKEKRHA